MGINGQDFNPEFQWRRMVCDMLAIFTILQGAYYAVIWIASHVRII